MFDIEDGQFCVIEDSQELALFVGNMTGDYLFDLGVIEDSFGYFKIIRLSDIHRIDAREAREFDRVAYELLMENKREYKDE